MKLSDEYYLLAQMKFPPDRSRAFLRAYLNANLASDEALAQLAEALEHHAIALDLARRYVREKQITIPEYLEHLWKPIAHPLMLDWRSSGGTINPIPYATFANAWVNGVKGRGTRRLFVIAGHCATECPIPLDFLKAAWKDEMARFLMDSVISWFTRLFGRPRFDRALDNLASLGLLRWEDREQGPAVLGLLSYYTQAQTLIPKPLMSLCHTLIGFGTHYLKTAPARFEPLLPHAEIIAETTEEEAAKGLEDAEIALESAGLVWKCIALYLQASGEHEQAQVIFGKAAHILGSITPSKYPRMWILREAVERASQGRRK